MRMIFAPLAFLGALAVSSSSAAVTSFGPPASMPAAWPALIVADAGKPRAAQIDGVDDQLSHEERTVIAFLSLKADAERNNR